MASEVKTDKLSQRGSSGIVITDDIKLSSGKAIKNAAGTALLGEDGALGSGIVFPTGHIIQHEFLPMTSEDATSSDEFETTGFYKAITPSSTSNKVLIVVTTNLHNSAESYYYLQIIGSTNGALGHSANGFGSIKGYAANRHFATISYLDSPGVDVLETYTIHHKISDTAHTGAINVSGATGYIHLFEIAG